MGVPIERLAVAWSLHERIGGQDPTQRQIVAPAVQSRQAEGVRILVAAEAARSRDGPRCPSADADLVIRGSATSASLGGEALRTTSLAASSALARYPPYVRLDARTWH